MNDVQEMNKPDRKKLMITAGVIAVVAVIVVALIFATRKKDDLTATTIKILNFVGGVHLSGDNGDITMRKDMQLHNGNVVSTDSDGSIDLMLDDSKAAGLDVDSKAAFEQNGKSMKINVQEGSLYFYATEKLASDETCDIETQTLMVGIRGTVVEMFYDPATGVTELTVPAGEVEVTGTNPTTQGQRTQVVTAGQRVRTCFFNNEEGEKSILFSVEDVRPEDLSPLTLQKIVENEAALQEVTQQTGWSESEMRERASEVQTVNASVPGSEANAQTASAYRQEASGRAEEAVYSTLEEALESDNPAIRAAAQTLIEMGIDGEEADEAEGAEADEGEEAADGAGDDGDAAEDDDAAAANGTAPVAAAGANDGVNAGANAQANGAAAADANTAEDTNAAATAQTTTQTANTNGITTTSDGIQVSDSSSGGSSSDSGSSGSNTSVAVTGVSMSQSTLSLTPGASSKLTATVAPDNASNKTVTWVSSNTEVATVADDGTVTAGSALGTATITATTADGGYTATCQVTVAEATVAVTGVSISPEKADVTVGKTTTLTATVTPSNASNQSVTWASANEAVATVSGGVVTGVAAGSTTITVTTADGGFSAACSVVVKEAQSEVTYSVTATANPGEGGSASASPVSATEGTTVTLTATPATGYKLSKWDVTDGNGNIISVSSSNTFTMPASNVDAVAVFTLKRKYSISATGQFNGDTVEGCLSPEPTEATEGDEVRVFVNTTPENYALDTISVTAGNTTISFEKKSGEISFNMPGDNVDVTAEYIEASGKIMYSGETISAIYYKDFLGGDVDLYSNTERGVPAGVTVFVKVGASGTSVVYFIGSDAGGDGIQAEYDSSEGAYKVPIPEDMPQGSVIHITERGN